MNITYDLSKNELSPEILHKGFSENYLFAMSGGYEENIEYLIFLGSNKNAGKDYYLVHMDRIIEVKMPYITQIGEHFTVRFATDQCDVKQIENNIDNLNYASWLSAYFKVKRLLLLK